MAHTGRGSHAKVTPSSRPRGWRTASVNASSRLAPFISRINLDTADGDKPRTSWVQVLRTGDLYDPRYGDFSVTAKHLATMLENFKSGTFPVAPTKLFIDYNHGTSSPKTAEQGKAAGWITDLALRDAGDELWALVEWNDAAAQMIEEKEYQFLSASFSFNYKNSNGGDEIGATLFGAALTNTPVVHGMAAAELSLATAGAKWLTTLAADDEVDEDIAEAFSFDEQRRRVQAALSAAFGSVYGFDDGYGPCCGCYLVDMFDGRAIYRTYGREYGGDTYEVHFTIDANGVVAFTDSPAEVVADYRPLGVTEMSKHITVKDHKGNEVQLTEEVVLALAKTHAPEPAPGTVVDMAAFNELKAKAEATDAKVLDLTAKNLALETDAKKRVAEGKVDAGIRAGKIAPAERDEQVELALANGELFDKLLAKRPVSTEFNRVTGSENDGSQTTAADQAIALARAEMDADKTLTQATALSRVFQKDPALYQRYTKESAVRV